MTQRRTPSGQGPARRPGQAGRPGGRVSSRDTAARTELRTGRATAPRVQGAARAAEMSRSASRPAAARRAAATGATKRTVAERPRAFTGRATVLLVVLVTLALGYTYPVRVYLDQESEIARMKAANAEQQAEIGKLGETLDKWKDPEYLKIKARERLHYTDPGESLLVVFDDPEAAALEAGIDSTDVAGPDRWYDTLWSSISAANAEPRP